MLIQEIDILRDEYISTCKILLSISIIASVLVLEWYIYRVLRITTSVVSILQLHIFGFDPTLVSLIDSQRDNCELFDRFIQ